MKVNIERIVLMKITAVCLGISQSQASRSYWNCYEITVLESRLEEVLGRNQGPTKIDVVN
jgi:hypothetical protein